MCMNGNQNIGNGFNGNNNGAGNTGGGLNGNGNGNDNAPGGAVFVGPIFKPIDEIFLPVAKSQEKDDQY